jgi:zinc transporter 1
MKIAEKVKEFFHNEGIHSTTIQPEFVEMNEVGVLGRDSDFSSVLLCFNSSIIR